jgi:predicted HicB family RNase H-like nuclease
MRYKDYMVIGSFSTEDECFMGHIGGINDIISFHIDSVEEECKAV